MLALLAQAPSLTCTSKELTRVATGGRFELALPRGQLGLIDCNERNMVSAQKTLRLDSGKAEHFRDLVECQSLLAVGLSS